MAKKTILIVDDEQTFLDALADALEFNSYKVLRAASASEALEILQTMPVNLASVDIMLDPGADLSDNFGSEQAGLHLLQILREKHPSVKKFSLSVVTDANLIKKIQATGANFFKKGEVPLRTYLDRIDRALENVMPATTVSKRKWK